jgi:hypothetical protein
MSFCIFVEVSPLHFSQLLYTRYASIIFGGFCVEIGNLNKSKQIGFQHGIASDIVNQYIQINIPVMEFLYTFAVGTAYVRQSDHAILHSTGTT